MDLPTLQLLLEDLPLGAVDYSPVLDSTNARAQRWISSGASHLSLVVADEQTAGRGRNGRIWLTPPGSAIAFSLILLPEVNNPISIPYLSPLGALAVCESLQSMYDLPALIKWPNDILLFGEKAAGILVETEWQGEQFHSAVLGIGINVAPGSVPQPSEINFPATCVEGALGRSVDRWALMKGVIERVIKRLQDFDQQKFLQAWEDKLAFTGETVQLLRKDEQPIIGQLEGLMRDGSLRLLLPNGKVLSVRAGEIHLRAVDS